MSPGPGMDETINNRAGGINEFEESKGEVNKLTNSLLYHKILHLQPL